MDSFTTKLHSPFMFLSMSTMQGTLALVLALLLMLHSLELISSIIAWTNNQQLSDLLMKLSIMLLSLLLLTLTRFNIFSKSFRFPLLYPPFIVTIWDLFDYLSMIKFSSTHFMSNMSLLFINSLIHLPNHFISNHSQLIMPAWHTF